MPTPKPDQSAASAVEHQNPNKALGDVRPNNELTVDEPDRATERWQNLSEELASLQVRHNQVIQELREERAIRNQMQNSHGWKALSVYYKLRTNVFPKRMAAFLKEGVALVRDMRLVSKSRLFDKAWYLQRNPDVARAGVSPLRHYVRRGGFEGRDPNPHFSSDWYLSQYPDATKARVNPLVHYLRHGANEGCDPSPHFDTDWYLEQNPDVARARMNPLAHYVLHGAAEGRAPRAGFANQRETAAAAGLLSQPSATNLSAAGPSPSPNGDSGLPRTSTGGEKRPRIKPHPITGSVRPKRPKTATDKKLICVTHVLPYPSRAGNEYRIHRMLDWFAMNGFEVFLVICPLPNYSVAPQRLVDACSVYPNLLWSQRDGVVLYQLAEGNGLLKGVTNVKPRDFGALLAEDAADTRLSQRLLPIVRMFCPDSFLELLLHLDSVLKPEVVLVDYVFMTRALPLMRRESLKVVDTIDVFSTKHDKVITYGIEDGLALKPEEEASLLEWADLVIAIQADEAEELRRLVPHKPVITASIDFCQVESVGAPAAKPVLLLVASDNALNVKGLKDFLRFAWPLVRREVPDAELRIIGAVGLLVEVDDPSIKVLGPVDDLTTAYADARVILNPAVAGTGLKIKTIEALCHLRPLVSWPSGVDGVEGDVQQLCYIATDWYMFAEHVIHLCKSVDASQALVGNCNDLFRRFSPEAVYGELKAALSSVQAVAR